MNAPLNALSPSPAFADGKPRIGQACTLTTGQSAVLIMVMPRTRIGPPALREYREGLAGVPGCEDTDKRILEHALRGMWKLLAEGVREE